LLIKYIQQHLALPVLQPHVGSPPENIPANMPAAQPTPDFTVMAPEGQFKAQAPHSIHKLRFAIFAFLASITNTACGHTMVHMVQPVHFSVSNFRVTTFCK
jgi:hypothetical protein